MWCLGPLVRFLKIELGALKMVLQMCLSALCAPMFEMCGLCFSKVKVKYQRLKDGEEKDEQYVV